ncbi:MAG: CHASE2 domain-containing protein, partial [bacterium]
MGLFSIRIRTLAIGFVLFVVSWFLLSFLLRVDFIHALHETSEAFIYNQIFASRARPSEDVILLDEGQNEHSRQHYGNLIASLDAAGAKVIALDVLFNAERDSAQNILLITSTRKASRKIIHATEFIGIDNDEIIPHRYHLRTLGNCPVDFERANGVLLPFRDLLKAIKHLGHITHTASMTGREEHYFQPVICYNDRLYPSLPLLAVMKFRDCPTDTLPHAPEEDVVVFKSDTIDTQSIIPINHRGQALINFIPKKEFLTRTYLIDSVRSLIMREPTIFNNKIVLIGNSFDSQEQSNGPHFETYPNLIIYATLISQMLRGENIREGILESILYSLALLALWLVGLTFMSERLEQFKLLILRLVGQMLRLEGFERFKFWPWEYYALAFLFFLIVAALNLLLGIRIYIILPYVAFCASSLLSKRYYEKRLGDLIGTKKRIKYLDYY